LCTRELIKIKIEKSQYITMRVLSKRNNNFTIEIKINKFNWLEKIYFKCKFKYIRKFNLRISSAKNALNACFFLFLFSGSKQAHCTSKFNHFIMWTLLTSLIEALSIAWICGSVCVYNKEKNQHLTEQLELLEEKNYLVVNYTPLHLRM